MASSCLVVWVLFFVSFGIFFFKKRYQLTGTHIVMIFSTCYVTCQHTFETRLHVSFFFFVMESFAKEIFPFVNWWHTQYNMRKFFFFFFFYIIYFFYLYKINVSNIKYYNFTK